MTPSSSRSFSTIQVFYENRIIKISRHVCIDVLTCNCLHLSNVRTETEKVKKYFSILPTLKTVFIYNQCILFLEIVQQLCHVGRLLATKIHTVLCLVLGLWCPAPRPRPRQVVQVPEPRECRHQLGVAGQRTLLEIRGLQTLVSSGSLRRVVPGNKI